MKKVPFYANLPDDLHCYQASLRMVLNYFLPKKKFTWKQLDRMTGQKKGLWTWATRGVLALQNMGFDIIDIEEFDYGKLARSAPAYLKELYGEEVGTEQIRHSDIPTVEKDAEEFVRRIPVDYRLPDFSDVNRLLDRGYLIGCLVNAKKLNGQTGYVGHFVVVFRCTDQTVFLHDPGLPPRKNRRVTRNVFLKAWAFPNEKAKNILAFRL